ncbi:MAG TPA: hypothetical protein VN374_07335 [Desulfitobacteriaceae bacterium]|nr:hypothetical protein [Desulfitobacteriaceae bacterium]
MKKKIMVILFASVLTVGILTGCGSKSNINSNTSNTSDTSNSAETSQTESNLLSKSFADMMKSGKYLMHYKMTISQDGNSTEAEITTAVDGNSISSISVTNGVKSHIVIKDKTMYMLNDTNKTYTKITIPDTASTQSGSNKIDTNGLIYTGKGMATLNGKELNYEEYKTDQGTIRYYFDGNKLYAIVVKSSGSEMVMTIIELSNNVTADMFEVPSGYTDTSASE